MRFFYISLKLDKIFLRLYNQTVGSDTLFFWGDILKTYMASLLTKITALYVDKLATPVLEPYSISPAQYKILTYLYLRPIGSVTTAELEEFFQMSHSTSVGLLNRLESGGYIKREKNGDSGRKKVIFLYDKAYALKEELIAAGKKIEQKFTERLTEEEIKEYIYLSQKVVGMK